MHSMRTNCILYNGTRKVRQRPRIRIVSGLCGRARAQPRPRGERDHSAGDEAEEVGVVEAIRDEALQGTVALRRVERAIVVKVDLLHRHLRAAGRPRVGGGRL